VAICAGEAKRLQSASRLCLLEAVEVLFASSTTEALIGFSTALDQENA
jgi:hypothetical protein